MFGWFRILMEIINIKSVIIFLTSLFTIFCVENKINDTTEGNRLNNELDQSFIGEDEKDEIGEEISDNFEQSTTTYKLKYKTTKNDIHQINLFGEKFVNNNRNKCKLIFNNKKTQLEHVYTTSCDANNGTLSIILSDNRSAKFEKY